MSDTSELSNYSLDEPVQPVSKPLLPSEMVIAKKQIYDDVFF
jgi:hypothetical protein